MKPFITLFTLFFGVAASQAQPVIYKDGTTLITGIWSGAGGGGTANLAEVSTNSPYEGSLHYRFDYAYTGWWAGLGLNMDNWGADAPRNLSGYTHLRIAYRGLTSGQTLTVQLRNNSDYGNSVVIGGSASSYTVVDVPVLSLTIGSPLDISAVREIDLSVGNAETGSGTVYFDAIELVNGSTGSEASAATWARANSLHTGLNTANWLEAYWLMPFNAYPETGKYNRANISALRDAGFDAFRLPVTFERICPTTPPYTIDFDQTAFHLVDSMILWAGLFDFRLIIDNHHGYPLTDANYTTEIPRLKAIWAQLAAHYDDLDPEQFLFEVYNEPTNAISSNNFRTVAAEVLASIRANETQTHSVLVGAAGWNSGGELTGFTPLDDPDIIYTFHSYDPFFFTHQGMSWTDPPYFPAMSFPQAGDVEGINQLFDNVKAWSDAYNVPVCLGEYGCATSADATSRCNWIETMTGAFHSNGFSGFYWDAISPTDAFGFYTGGVVSETMVIPCFAAAIGLYAEPLAVEFEDMSIACRDGLPVLNWSAFHSNEGDVFIVERSENGRQWETAGQMRAVPGSYRYEFTDKMAAAYYRLSARYPDGSKHVLRVQTADCGAPEPELILFPNPVSGQLHIKMTGDQKQLTAVRIMNSSGMQVLNRVSAGGFGHAALLDVGNLPGGVYWVQVQCGDETIAGQRLIVR